MLNINQVIIQRWKETEFLRWKRCSDIHPELPDDVMVLIAYNSSPDSSEVIHLLDVCDEEEYTRQQSSMFLAERTDSLSEVALYISTVAETAAVPAETFFVKHISDVAGLSYETSGLEGEEALKSIIRADTTKIRHK